MHDYNLTWGLPIALLPNNASAELFSPRQNKVSSRCGQHCFVHWVVSPSVSYTCCTILFLRERESHCVCIGVFVCMCVCVFSHVSHYMFMLNLHPCLQARQNDRNALHNNYMFHWNICFSLSLSLSFSLCLSVSLSLSLCVSACALMYLPVKCYFFPYVWVYTSLFPLVFFRLSGVKLPWLFIVLWQRSKPTAVTFKLSLYRCRNRRTIDLR